jgi:hypothetical protein
MSQIKGPQAAVEVEVDRDGTAGAGRAIRPADRSCCCAAPPAFKVNVMTTVPTPHSVELLMCGHHYRRSSSELARLGALVFDREGHLVSPAAEQTASSQTSQSIGVRS